MADNVVLNKAATLERCLQRVLEEYADDKQNLVTNQTKQDTIVLNLQRVCETTIDQAMYVISERKLGVPQDSRDAFAPLQAAAFFQSISQPDYKKWWSSATWPCTNTPA